MSISPLFSERISLGISIAVAKALFSRIPFALVLFHKFMEQVDKIFQNLPKLLKWSSFYENDLSILMDISEDVQKASIQNGLTRSQTKALKTLKAASVKEFQRVTGNNGRHFSKSVVSTGRKPSPYIDLRDLSSREIKGIAEKAAKKEGLVELNRPRVSPSSGQKIGTLLMGRLSIPV